MEIPTEPFLIGNYQIDPNYHLLLGFSEPSEYGVFWQEHEGLRYHWLTPEERHEVWWEQEGSKHFGACPRIPVSAAQLPVKFLEAMIKNAGLRDCCRNPFGQDIEAFFSSEDDKAKGAPDIYVLHCSCGRKHRRFMLGGGEPRPFWEVH